ncbi:MAG: carboxylating nicotinate-nucleotide diphosphorylase [bacterium]
MNTTRIIRKALQEDHFHKDITSWSLPDKLKIIAEIRTKQAGIVCGMDVAKQVFQEVDRKLSISPSKVDGDTISANELLLKVEGKAKSILAGERVALNFLQRLSGIATATDRFVTALNNKKIAIRDTRKTTPLLRKLEKYAVRIGGGECQRYNLADQVLFKDNHWICMKKAEMTLPEYFKKLRAELAKSRKLKKQKPIYIQIEAENLEEVALALTVEPNLILLDNMDVSTIEKAIALIAGKAKIEVSGGVNLENISNYSTLKIDSISIGALTHSVQVLDMSLSIVE